MNNNLTKKDKYINAVIQGFDSIIDGSQLEFKGGYAVNRNQCEELYIKSESLQQEYKDLKELGYKNGKSFGEQVLKSLNIDLVSGINRSIYLTNIETNDEHPTIIPTFKLAKCGIQLKFRQFSEPMHRSDMLNFSVNFKYTIE